MNKVVMPELGEGIDKAIVACWHVKVGDQVSKEDDIVELVTDKASFNIPVICDGVVDEICCAQGDEVNIGQVLAVIK